jgi:DNA (cytosine-5)-methyltransferase 1
VRYIDVCSGISAPTMAWKPLGWQALCFAEIEAAPRAVLAHHYPDVPLRGDFTEIEGTEYGPVDLLVGGTPCQSFSVAGLRGGLADDRGNLALQFARLAQRARPRWVVWENVPGVLSSNGGRDFGAILGALAELGYGLAYRVLDAQHFGVPQRRRRVFVVGHLGDWRRAAAVLFERHSMSGGAAPGGRAREKAAARFGFGVTGSVTGAYGKKRGGDEICQGSVIVVPYDFHQISAPINRQNRAVGDPCHTLAKDNTCRAVMLINGVPRYVTPREAERLQGFPDDFTLVPYRNGMMADGPRYKMLGNSMAVPVLRWIGERIQKVEAITAERIAA